MRLPPIRPALMVAVHSGQGKRRAMYPAAEAQRAGVTGRLAAWPNLAVLAVRPATTRLPGALAEVVCRGPAAEAAEVPRMTLSAGLAGHPIHMRLVAGVLAVPVQVLPAPRVLPDYSDVVVVAAAANPQVQVLREELEGRLAAAAVEGRREIQRRAVRVLLAVWAKFGFGRGDD